MLFINGSLRTSPEDGTIEDARRLIQQVAIGLTSAPIDDMRQMRMKATANPYAFTSTESAFNVRNI